MADAWTRYVALRPAFLAALGDQIATAVRRVDTRHPAFHGCIDWHSAVHGTYALLAVSRLTGDAGYRDVALAEVGGRKRLDTEVASVRAGHLGHEVPYGMAWALRLDTEATAGGVDDFHALGVSARKLLVDHLRSYGTRPGGLLSTAYASTIWAADSLLSWSDAFDDAEGREVASELARHIVRSEAVPGAGSARPDAAPRGFFSPCHLWLLLALHAGYKAPELTGAIQAVRDTTLHPPAQLRSVHAAGLNFSRAWGCHAAWALTGDVRHRETFAALVTGHLDLPGYWRDSYERYGHWVAQFGVFAIALAQNTTDAVGDNEETT